MFVLSSGDIDPSMKMEFRIAARCAVKLLLVFCQEGSQVSAGQYLIVIEAA